MKRWLVKSDPEEYSAHDLARDGRTAWTGVRNPTAVAHLRAMTPGDEVLVYHTGAEKAIVATAAVCGEPRPDPSDASSAVVDLSFEGWLEQPVTLKAVKEDKFFADFDLVRLSRLSVMPVSAAQWSRLLRMGGGLREPG